MAVSALSIWEVIWLCKKGKFYLAIPALFINQYFMTQDYDIEHYKIDDVPFVQYQILVLLSLIVVTFGVIIYLKSLSQSVNFSRRIFLISLIKLCLVAEGLHNVIHVLKFMGLILVIYKTVGKVKRL